MEGNTVTYIVVACVIGFMLIVMIGASIAAARCDSCGAFFAMERKSKKEISRTPCSKLEKLDIKDAKGNIVGTSESRRYGYAITYIITYKCKVCGHTEERKEIAEEYK